MVQILVLAIGVLLYGSFLHLTTRNSIQKHPDHTINGLKKYPKNKKTTHSGHLACVKTEKSTWVRKRNPNIPKSHSVTKIGDMQAC